MQRDSSKSKEVSVTEWLDVLGRSGQKLPSEISVYIVLETMERCSNPSRKVQTDDIFIHPDGSLSWKAEIEPLAENDVVPHMRSLLRKFLVDSRHKVEPRLYETAMKDEAMSLEAFKNELASCIVPFNVDATKRTLSRMTRDSDASIPTFTDEDERKLNLEVDRFFNLDATGIPQGSVEKSFPIASHEHKEEFKRPELQFLPASSEVTRRISPYTLFGVALVVGVAMAILVWALSRG